jgi:uncharacterized membrane protein
MNTPLTAESKPQADFQRLKNVTITVYALQAATFVLPITYFVAIIISYIKRDDAQGTWLESHFRWQIRTFWFTLLWFALGGLTFFIVIGWFILCANVLWFIYRIAKGWLNLIDDKPMPV